MAVEPISNGTLSDAERGGDLSRGLAFCPQPQNLAHAHGDARTAKPFAVLPSNANPRSNPLPYQIALKLCVTGNTW